MYRNSMHLHSNIVAKSLCHGSNVPFLGVLSTPIVTGSSPAMATKTLVKSNGDFDLNRERPENRYGGGAGNAHYIVNRTETSHP